MHPEAEIESRRPLGVAAAIGKRLAVHFGVGERAVREEQAGVERDAAIEEMIQADVLSANEKRRPRSA